MRLALGFCGQFAKATFSSLSIKKLEVGQHFEVRRFVFTPCLWPLSLNHFGLFREKVSRCVSRQYDPSVIYRNIFFDDSNSISITPAHVIALLSLLISVHFPTSSHISSCEAGGVSLPSRVGGWERSGKLELISLLLCVADCLVCSVDGCLSHTVLNTANLFHEMGQIYSFCFWLAPVHRVAADVCTVQ